MTERDYGTTMLCKCGWRGPFYLMLPATSYPGTARCPKCGSDGAAADDWGRREFEQRLADIAAVRAGAMTLEAAQRAARRRSRKSGMSGSDAYRAMRDSQTR